MASITIRNLDDNVKKRLRKQAAENGRSLEAEAREILSRSAAIAAKPPLTGLDMMRPLRDFVSKYGGVTLDIPPRTPMRDLPFQEEAATFRRNEARKRKLRKK